VAKTMFFCNTL